MLTAAQTREQTIAVERAFDYMRRHRVTLADLIEVGGADLKSRDSKRAEQARRVGKTWELIAQLGLTYTALESGHHANSATATLSIPEKRSRRRRGEGHFLQVPENAQVLDIQGAEGKPNKINDLGNFGPVGSPEMKSPNYAGAVATPCNEADAMSGAGLDSFGRK
jgi:hypothetical protein